MSSNNRNVPKKQRAIILQGGGALGAYESGVLTELCNHLADEDNKRNNEKERGPLFDVIAGTSIGAMNAAVLVSNVVNRKKTWKEAAEVLEHFWTNEAKIEEKEDMKKGGLSSTPPFNEKWWQWEKSQNKLQASSEAARRHYSVKYLLRYGAPNVFYPHIPEFDFKFGDADNPWFVYDSSPLEQTIKRYSIDEKQEKKDGDSLRIATSWERGEPRLLVMSVDVVEGKTVAFDSYHTENEDPGNSLYDGRDGITINHIMASGTLPIFYKFRKIPTKGGRKFCDGGILSNTPLRELLQAHKDYWKRVVGEDQDEIPDLDVYVINVHPPKWEKVSKDGENNKDEDDENKKDEDYLDAVQDRINDLIFSDRNSHYEEMVADLVTDYKDLLTSHTKLLDNLKELAKKHFNNKDQSNATFREEFESILNYTEEKSWGGMVEDRKYKDLIKGRFKVRVTRIENEGYEDSIYGKGGDFTSKTIRSLIEKGKQDAQKVIRGQ